jgi:hypothetical protein
MNLGRRSCRVFVDEGIQGDGWLHFDAGIGATSRHETLAFNTVEGNCSGSGKQGVHDPGSPHGPSRPEGRQPVTSSVTTIGHSYLHIFSLGSTDTRGQGRASGGDWTPMGEHFYSRPVSQCG